MLRRWLAMFSIHNSGQFAIVCGLAFTAAGRFRHPASHWSTCGKLAKLTLPIRAHDSTEATLRSATVKVGPTK
jgi:hypothetical protein